MIVAISPMPCHTQIHGYCFGVGPRCTPYGLYYGRAILSGFLQCQAELYAKIPSIIFYDPPKFRSTFPFNNTLGTLKMEVTCQNHRFFRLGAK